MSVVSKRRRTTYSAGSSTSAAMQVAARLLGDPSVRSYVQSIASSGRRRVMDWARTTPTNMNYDEEPSKRKLAFKKLTPCRPKLKVSKAFRAKVHAVESAGTAKGVATVRIMGNIYVNSDQNQQNVIDYLSYGSGALKLTSTSAGTPNIDNTMQWYYPAKMNHWASVLFKGKANDIYVDNATGNFNNEQLVLEIPYISTKMTIHNPTMDVIELDFYMCVPKHNTNETANQEWANAVGSAAANISGQTTFWYGAEPGQLEAWTKKWSYKKKTWLLKPGQTVTHFEKQGPLCYTFAKFLNNTTNWAFPKGVGLSCFFITKQPIVRPNSVKISAHHTKAAAAGDYRTLTCEITHKYVIEAPEICDDDQKFDKYVTNSYVGGGSLFIQTQVGTSGDTVKDTYYKDPGLGPVTVV